VATPPTITKAFGAASIPLNGSTSLTFNITNPNTGIALTGIAFTDNLPAGLVIATPNALNSTCGGTATAVAGPPASVSPRNSCRQRFLYGFSKRHRHDRGSKEQQRPGDFHRRWHRHTSNASIMVVAPPVIIKAFGAASIPLNGSTSLSFTIQNNNTTTTLTGVGLAILCQRAWWFRRPTA